MKALDPGLGRPSLRLLVAVIAIAAILLASLERPQSADAAAGVDWIARDSAANESWLSVAYGDGLFVAVANNDTGNRVMTSPDGITWTSRSSPPHNQWTDVTYGNGLFVAVANSGTGNRVMTSSDGINWTSRAAAAANQW